MVGADVVAQDRHRLRIAFREIVGVEDALLHTDKLDTPCAVADAAVAPRPKVQRLRRVDHGLGIEDQHVLRKPIRGAGSTLRLPAGI